VSGRAVVLAMGLVALSAMAPATPLKPGLRPGWRGARESACRPAADSQAGRLRHWETGGARRLAR